MRFLILFLALFALLAFAQDDAPADDAPAAPDADPPAAEDPPATPDAPPADEAPAAPDAPAADNPETPNAPDTPAGDAPSGDTTSTEPSTVNAPSNDTRSAPTTPNSDAPSEVPSTEESSTEAPVVDNNPIGTQYTAILPNRTDTTVRGAVAVNSHSNGTGANVQISVSGLPAEGGPFMYHIHKFPISGLNCTTAGSHLDPYGATEVPACNPAEPDKCEVGDLSGKHGNMTGPSFSANYVDLFLSTEKGTPAFVGDLSIVVHSSNKSRLSCANFTLQGTNLGAGSPGPAQSSSLISSSPSVTTAGPPTLAYFLHLLHNVLDFDHRGAGDFVTACAFADCDIFNDDNGGLCHADTACDDSVPNNRDLSGSSVGRRVVDGDCALRAPSTLTVAPSITEVIVSSTSTLQTVVLISSTVTLTSCAKKVSGWTTVIPAPPSVEAASASSSSWNNIVSIVVPTFTLFNPAILPKPPVAVSNGAVTNILHTEGVLNPLEPITSTLEPIAAPTSVLGNTSVINAPATPTAPGTTVTHAAAADKIASAGGMGLVGALVAMGAWVL
ncbi:hypothetical protein MBLNU13_g09704t2 [Cladosporium sp. NU13]